MSTSPNTSIPELPPHEPVTPHSFETDNFDVEEYLSTHAQFDTLPDTLNALSDVVSQFENQLLENVNNQFFKTTKQLSKLEQTPDLLSQAQQATQIAITKSDETELLFSDRHFEIQNELLNHKNLSILENKCQQMQTMFDLYAELEQACYSDLSKLEAVQLSKALVSLNMFLNKFKDTRSAQHVNAAVSVYKRNILQRISELNSENPDLELLEAAEYVKDS